MNNNQNYERFSEGDIDSHLQHWIAGGIDYGMKLGFPTFIGDSENYGLDDLYRVRLGSTTYIFGIPAHGKTTFTNEVLINLSEFHGLKHAVLSPESGTITEIKRDILEMWVKKSFFNVPKWDVLDLYNKTQAHIPTLDDHFYFMKPKSKSITDVMECAKEMVLELGVNTITIDPWNEFEHDFGTLREDQYLAKALGNIRDFSVEHNVHVFVVAHPKTLQKDKNGSFLPPSFYDMSGGSMWSNKAMSVICPFRANMIDDDNSVDILVLKSKPRYTGRKGISKMYYDRATCRYYRMNGYDKVFANDPNTSGVPMLIATPEVVTNLNEYIEPKEEYPF